MLLISIFYIKIEKKKQKNSKKIKYLLHEIGKKNYSRNYNKLYISNIK